MFVSKKAEKELIKVLVAYGTHHEYLILKEVEMFYIYIWNMSLCNEAIEWISLYEINDKKYLNLQSVTCNLTVSPSLCSVWLLHMEYLEISQRKDQK